jgi:hypothetical protein
MALMKPKTAAIASIITIIIWSVIVITTAVLVAASGGSTFIQAFATVTATTALTLSVASSAMIIFVHKLGWHCSRSHDILQWTAFVSWGVALPFALFIEYQRSSLFFLMMMGISFISWIRSAVKTIKKMFFPPAPFSSSHSSSQAHDLENNNDINIQDDSYNNQKPYFFHTPSSLEIWNPFIGAITIILIWCIILACLVDID